jgi:hypothetical protein
VATTAIFSQPTAIRLLSATRPLVFLHTSGRIAEVTAAPFDHNARRIQPFASFPRSQAIAVE